MPRNAIEKHNYVNDLGATVREIVSKFGNYTNTLTSLFGEIDNFIADEDTPPEMVAVLITKRAQGITLLQNMINSL